MHDTANNSLGEVNLTTYTGTFATSTWYDVQIPLTDIHSQANATTSRGFTFISDTITTAYFDNIRFISSSTQTTYNQATTTTKYLHADHLGGTNVVTNSSGNTTEVTDYYPYGSPRINSLTGGTAEQRKYIGEHYDTDTNLSYLNARYYEGIRGQFLSQDPVFWEIGESEDGRKILVDPQLANSYSYAGGNPITKKDPKGRGPEVLVLLLAPQITIPLAIIGTLGFLGIYYATLPGSSPKWQQKPFDRLLPDIEPPGLFDNRPPHINPNGPKWGPWFIGCVLACGAASDLLEKLERLKGWARELIDRARTPAGDASSSSANSNPGLYPGSGASTQITSSQASALEGILDAFAPKNDEQAKAVQEVFEAFGGGKAPNPSN